MSFWAYIGPLWRSRIRVFNKSISSPPHAHCSWVNMGKRKERPRTLQDGSAALKHLLQRKLPRSMTARSALVRLERWVAYSVASTCLALANQSTQSCKEEEGLQGK